MSASARSRLAPTDYRRQLGGSFVDHLTDAKYPALIIGKDSWTRHELATEIGIVHTKAAAILTKACRTLGIRSTADLFARTSPYTFADVQLRMGVTTLYVMFAVFRAKGHDIDAWYAKGNTKGEAAAVVTFITLKEREQAAEKRTTKGRKDQT